MTGLPQLSRFDSNSPNKNFNSQIFFGNYIHFLPSVTSTNDTAMELAEKGWPEGTVVVSDTQTRGRGRAGRLWHSPKGVSLYFTVILRPGMKLKNAPLITLMAAAASVNVPAVSTMSSRITATLSLTSPMTAIAFAWWAGLALLESVSAKMRRFRPRYWQSQPAAGRKKRRIGYV